MKKREDRGKNLGKQLFTYFIQHIQSINPTITTVRWNAATLDSYYISQKKLEQWYTQRGGKKIAAHPAGGSMFELHIKDFKPEQDISMITALMLDESSTIESTNTLALLYNDQHIASIIYRLCINLNHTEQTNDTTYAIQIKNSTIDTNDTSLQQELTTMLKKEILKKIANKRWLSLRSKL